MQKEFFVPENKYQWHGISYYLKAIPLVILFRYILLKLTGLDGFFLTMFSATLGFLAADMPEIITIIKNKKSNKNVTN
jgi:hypothetical protein